MLSLKKLSRIYVNIVAAALLFGVSYFIYAGFSGASVSEPFTNPHGDYNVSESVYGTPKCAKCHSGHSAYSISLLTGTTQRETCYNCHDAGTGVVNIRGQFGEETIGSSVYAGSGSFHPVPTGVQFCTDCHDPHLATEDSPGGTASLLDVGNPAQSSGNEVCGYCHGTGGLLPGGDMLASFTGTAHDVEMNAPASGTQIKCIRCHEPHGSPYTDLIRRAITDEVGTVRNVTGNNNTVCFGCHTGGMGTYSGSVIYNAVYHGSKTSSTVALTTYSGTTYAATLCMNCHEPHGKTGVSYYRRAEGNTLCVTCHDDESVAGSRPADYSYRGINIYNDTPHSSAGSPPRTYTYNLGTDGSAAWEEYGPLDQQPVPSSPGTQASADDKSKAASTDSIYWTTGSALDQEYNFQVYKFHVNQDLTNLRELSGKWTGYGEPTAGYPVELFIWNKNTPGWEALASQQLGSPGTMTWLRTSDFGRYLDENNDLYILARAKHDGTGPVVSNWGPQFNTTSKWADIVWTTDEQATTRVDYGTTAEYGTTVTVDGYRTSHSVRLSNLTAGQTYYYKITTVDQLGNETVVTSSFVARCGSPVLTPEEDMEQDEVFEFNVTLEWSSVPDLDSQTVRYDVQISKVADFSSIYSELTDTTATSWSTTITHSGGVNTSNTWYWRVRAKDSYGSVSDWSTDSFTTYVNSCPILYTWNGEKFEYNTDLMAGSIVGLEMSPGQYKAPVPDEQVTISGDLLKEKDGYYVLKIKNEQHEVDFIDSLVLEAVDHPVGTRIGLNDFNRSTEPYKLYTYSENLRPVKKATYVNNPAWSGGDAGSPKDVTDLVSRIDNRHAVGKLFDDNRFTLELGDLSDAREIKLVIVGWTEFATAADRELRVQTAATGRPTAKHYVEVLQPDGTWRSEEIKHIPGYTKTGVIDLTGKFAEGTKEYVVRLRGLYRPHLDFIGVDTTPQADITVTPLRLSNVELSYSTPSSYIKYPSPYFDYYDARTFNLWTHEGSFTRYGDVLPLVKQADDKLVVMDTGDELTASFEASPPPAPGMTRSFVLKPFGYYKELSEAKVEPMPFRNMDISQYPESLGEYPQELKDYVKEWNTRVHKAGDNAVYNTGEKLASATAKPGFLQGIKLFVVRIFDWVAALLNNLAGIFTPDNPAGKSSAIYSNSERIADNGTGSTVRHYSLNTDYVELTVKAADPGTPDGYCGNCHTPHGRDDGTGSPIHKQLYAAEDSVCFGGGLGCHSDSTNSARGINIYDRFTASSNPTAHHSIDSAEQASQGTKVECKNCHDPHLNTAENKVVDPMDRYTTYNITREFINYIDNDGYVYLMVKAKHDGDPPGITSGPTLSNHTASGARISWASDEITTGILYWGPDSGYGNETTSPMGTNTNHYADMTDLTLFQNYHYKIRIQDALGNYYETGDYNLDSTKPSITSGPSVANAAGTSLSIVWMTNESSTSWVDYVSTVSHTVYGYTYAVSAGNDTLVTSHSVDISDLTPGTEYTYRVRSMDMRGNERISSDGTFQATNAPPPPDLIEEPDHIDYTTPITVDLDWYESIDPDGDSVQYYAEISTSSSFSPVYSNSGWIDGTTWPATIDNEGSVTWYWRVKARDEWNAESVWSSVYSFVHQGPDPPPSCPNLYVWNGKKYEFVTDMGSAQIGGVEANTGKSRELFPGLPIAIPWNMLQEKDGKYTIKIKSERDEVDFIDYADLLAVDHPVGTRVALNDLNRGNEPGKIYTYSEDLKPIKKVTYVNNPVYSGGKPSKPIDVTDLVAKLDNLETPGSYQDDNQITFDLGDLHGAENIRLVMTGRTEYANKAERIERAEKRKKGVKGAKTFLEILQPDGTWKREDMRGFSGMNKTVVLDLSGKFPKDTQKYIVRLRGMTRPHIDFAGIDTTPEAKYTSKTPELLDADLGYRGVSKSTNRPSPYFDYDKLMERVKLHAGKFTRYGDVIPLLKEVDDKPVVMDTGDEITMNFRALPPPAPGMTRSFILKRWVYYKESNLAQPEPIPFRDMDQSKLPDSLGEYPPELKAYAAEWNTRVHNAGQKAEPGIWDRIEKFFAGIIQSIRNLWNSIFGKPEQVTVLDYELNPYPDSWTPMPPWEEHFSLNTNYVLLHADTPVGAVVYDVNSAGFGMWESDTEPSPSSPGTDISGDKALVASDDSSRKATDYYQTPNQDDGAYNYQMYRFKIGTPVEEMFGLRIMWKGYGEPSPGYDVTVSLWNYATPGWNNITSKDIGFEISVNSQKNTDFQSYCYKCHAGTVPPGVQLGPITRNISNTYTGDIHGGGSGLQVLSPDGGGDWTPTYYSSGASISPSYARGNQALPCTDCHDIHGSGNAYHLRENLNGSTGKSVPEMSNNTNVLSYCQSCHAGTLNEFHLVCVDCHNSGTDHQNAPRAADFGRSCISCHYHGATYPEHGECHCWLRGTTKAF
ncbi:MAG: hypothetical protein CVU89_01925 [Firmicutes bacterium HGW-Firmicutes-14]|nr:MAG: hypothetical protein CVU89_01925 [Firmicutes bacterium HGW-Firmicutes-14]